MRKPLRTILIAAALAASLAPPLVPAHAANAQQERMASCNKDAAGKKGDDRKAFMSSCLRGETAAPSGPTCDKGKPCGNSCIAMDKVCRK